KIGASARVAPADSTWSACSRPLGEMRTNRTRPARTTHSPVAGSPSAKITLPLATFFTRQRDARPARSRAESGAKYGMAARPAAASASTVTLVIDGRPPETETGPITGGYANEDVDAGSRDRCGRRGSNRCGGHNGGGPARVRRRRPRRGRPLRLRGGRPVAQGIPPGRGRRP